MTATRNALMEANEEQADTVDVSDVKQALTGRLLLNRPMLLLQNR